MLVHPIAFLIYASLHTSSHTGWDGALSNEMWLDIKNAMTAAAPIVAPGYGMDSESYLAYLNETMENIRDGKAYFNWWGCCAQKAV
jgi:hypothetical protein